MIKIIKGNLLTVERGIIGHQVNCQGVMGSGVARQIKDKYPLAFSAYKDVVMDFMGTEDLRHTLLGHVNGVCVGEDLYVANMFGQNKFGYDGKQYTNAEALFNCFKTIRKTAENLDLPVAMPYMIGCYRGGADWRVVEDYILTAFDGFNELTLYKYHEG